MVVFSTYFDVLFLKKPTYMMSLFNLILRATVDKDSNAIWEIILMFEPYIRKASISSYSGKIDEDLMSYIQMKLYTRISNFNIFKD